MSSNDFAISANGLGKCYQIYNAPRDRFKQFVMPPLRGMLGLPAHAYYHEFWALKEVSFEIKRGETVAIVGRNGSGKSTLLQILCGTLNATQGQYKTKGRIAALLELGSGFNPEFSGRDNVYLNAALLGLTKSQVDERFDAIEKFADIGEFIEQPVKTYSSGMYVRLAFSVIAHVDADILVIDEALSVGDAVFTQKCMRFIRDFQKNGTLIFVSHDMGSVQNLCEKAIWLGRGEVIKTGTSKEIAEAYLQYTLQEVYGDQITLQKNIEFEGEIKSDEKSDADYPILNYLAEFSGKSNVNQAKGWKTGAAEVLGVSLENMHPTETQGIFKGWDQVKLTVHAHAHQAMVNPILGFLVRDRLGQDLFGENTLPFSARSILSVKAGQDFSAEFIFTLPMLPNGQYAVMASVADGDLYNNVQHHWLHDAYIINVSSSIVRWGLVGVPFQSLSLKVKDD